MTRAPPSTEASARRSAPKSAPKGWVYYKAHKFSERGYAPYTKAIGEVALAWNDLNEQMSVLFSCLMGGGQMGRALALWHAPTTDRPKRLLLFAAAQFPAPEQKKIARLFDDVKWITDRAQEFEDARNNAVHSPLLLIKSSGSGLIPPEWDGRVITQTLWNNPRALRMALKDLLVEFRWCRDSITKLRDFTHQVTEGIQRGGVPWPDRPKLPVRKPKKIRKGQRPQPRTK
jgi:hypothetical protein